MLLIAGLAAWAPLIAPRPRRASHHLSIVMSDDTPLDKVSRDLSKARERARLT